MFDYGPRGYLGPLDTCLLGLRFVALIEPDQLYVGGFSPTSGLLVPRPSYLGLDDQGLVQTFAVLRRWGGANESARSTIKMVGPGRSAIREPFCTWFMPYRDGDGTQTWQQMRGRVQSAQFERVEELLCSSPLEVLGKRLLLQCSAQDKDVAVAGLSALNGTVRLLMPPTTIYAGHMLLAVAIPPPGGGPAVAEFDNFRPIEISYEIL